MSRRGIHPLLMGLDKPDSKAEDKPLGRPSTQMAGLESPHHKRMNEMSPTKLTNAPEGFEYYRVCDQEGVCHVVRGMEEVRRLLEKRPGLNVTKIP